MIAPEGLVFIVGVTIVLLLMIGLGIFRKRLILLVLAIPVFIVWLLMLYFFRDPTRPLPEYEKIVSPTDGTVLSISGDDSSGTNIVIFLSLLDVHAIRAPVSGELISKKYMPGEFHRANTDLAGIENEHVDLSFCTPYGTINARVIAGLVARRIVVNIETGYNYRAGERIGFIRFGSRSEINLPPGVKTLLNIGDKVTGGVTEIAAY